MYAVLPQENICGPSERLHSMELRNHNKKKLCSAAIEKPRESRYQNVLPSLDTYLACAFSSCIILKIQLYTTDTNAHGFHYFA